MRASRQSTEPPTPAIEPRPQINPRVHPSEHAPSEGRGRFRGGRPRPRLPAAPAPPLLYPLRLDSRLAESRAPSSASCRASGGFSSMADPRPPSSASSSSSSCCSPDRAPSPGSAPASVRWGRCIYMHKSVYEMRRLRGQPARYLSTGTDGRSTGGTPTPSAPAPHPRLPTASMRRGPTHLEIGQPPRRRRRPASWCGSVGGRRMRCF